MARTVENLMKLLRVEKAIDVRCHLGKYRAWLWEAAKEDPEFSAEVAMKQQDDIGVTKAVVSPCSDPPYFYEDQEYVMTVAKEHPDRFPVALCRVNWLDWKTSLKEIEKCAKVDAYKGVSSYNVVTQVQGAKLYGPQAKMIFDKMKDLGWNTVLFDVPEDASLGAAGVAYPSPAEVEMAAGRYPDIKFIIRGLWDFTELVKTCKNLYFEARDAIVPFQEIELDRTMFGSNAGFAHYYCTLPVLVYKMALLNMPKDTQEKILYRNAQKVFKIRA